MPAHWGRSLCFWLFGKCILNHTCDELARVYRFQLTSWIKQQMVEKRNRPEVTMEENNHGARERQMKGKGMYTPLIDVDITSEPDRGWFGGGKIAKFNTTVMYMIKKVKTSAIWSQSSFKNTRWILPPPLCDNKHPQPRIWLHLSLYPHSLNLPKVLSSIVFQLQPLLPDRKKGKKENITASDSNIHPPHSATCTLRLKFADGKNPPWSYLVKCG